MSAGTQKAYRYTERNSQLRVFYFINETLDKIKPAIFVGTSAIFIKILTKLRNDKPAIFIKILTKLKNGKPAIFKM